MILLLSFGRFYYCCWFFSFLFLRCFTFFFCLFCFAVFIIFFNKICVYLLYEKKTHIFLIKIGWSAVQLAPMWRLDHSFFLKYKKQYLFFCLLNYLSLILIIIIIVTRIKEKKIFSVEAILTAIYHINHCLYINTHQIHIVYIS